MDVYTLDIEHLGPEPCQNLLQRCARAGACWRRRYLHGRGQSELLRQTAALQFARRAARQVVHNHDLLWDLKRRQVRRGKLANIPVSRQRVRMQHDRCRHCLAQPRMGHRKGYSLGYGGMVHQHVVHFVRSNFFSTTVDDFLDTTGDEEITLNIHISLVTRPEPARREGVAVGRSVVGALHNARPTDHDLPRGTCRQQVPKLIHNGQLCAHCQAHRTSLTRTRRQRITRDHGDFCRPIGLNHRGIEHAL